MLERGARLVDGGRLRVGWHVEVVVVLLDRTQIGDDVCDVKVVQCFEWHAGDLSLSRWFVESKLKGAAYLLLIRGDLGSESGANWGQS